MYHGMAAGVYEVYGPSHNMEHEELSWTSNNGLYILRNPFFREVYTDALNRIYFTIAALNDGEVLLFGSIFHQPLQTIDEYYLD